VVLLWCVYGVGVFFLIFLVFFEFLRHGISFFGLEGVCFCFF